VEAISLPAFLFLLVKECRNTGFGGQGFVGGHNSFSERYSNSKNQNRN